MVSGLYTIYSGFNYDYKNAEKTQKTVARIAILSLTTPGFTYGPEILNNPEECDHMLKVLCHDQPHPVEHHGQNGNFPHSNVRVTSTTTASTSASAIVFGPSYRL
jgi:hypothetical protein